MNRKYDAVIVVSFGGPERPEDVIPFLENVLRGRNVPRERMLTVAEHYYEIGGVSPINAQNRALVAALVQELSQNGPQLPVYWGNRNWHPRLPDTLRQMSADGIACALAFFTSPYSSYSSCRQYLEDLERARTEVGERAPQVDKLRAYFNHPGFIEPMIELVQAALAQVPIERRASALILCSAHSIPRAMADRCCYEAQLNEAARLILEGACTNRWRLVYQSRSGPPNQPWLEPDMGAVLAEIGDQPGTRDVVVVPIGFISDHMEVVYDLDVEARHDAERLGLNLVRAGTVGTHPRFIKMIRQLLVERVGDRPERLAIGSFGPAPDVCPPECCR